MSDKDPSLRRNAPHLTLHVPEPAFRPGDTPENNAVAKITEGWIEEFQRLIGASVPTVGEG